jgi:hypothetical protein
MAAPACSPQGMHATYLFVLAPRDPELDAHTGVVLHAMVTIDKQRAFVRCMLDETTRVCEEFLQWHLRGN